MKYDRKTDRVLDTADLSDFTVEDWQRLAMACLDQSGLELERQERIRKILSYADFFGLPKGPGR